MPSPAHDNRQEIAQLLQAIDLSELAQSYGVSLKKKLGEFVGLCPFHDDKSPSLWINPVKQRFRCRACDAQGSSIDFVMLAERLDTGGAIRKLKSMAGGEPGAWVIAADKRVTSGKPKPQDWTPVHPVPGDAPFPTFRHYEYGVAAKYWAYKDTAGNVLGYVCRFDRPDGSKEVLPMTFCRHADARVDWRWMSFDRPRPLYNLPSLITRPHPAPVIIVEGEKTAVAAQKLFPRCAVVCWPGGSKSMKFVDWSPLKDRRVILWPDNDDPGRSAMFGWEERNGPQAGVAALVREAGAESVQAVIGAPKGAGVGWDLADPIPSVPDADAAGKFLKAHLGPVPPPLKPSKAEPKPSDLPPPPPAPALDHLPQAPAENEIPFRPLGYLKNKYGQNVFYFYSFKARQALVFTAGGFSKTALFQLADARFWEHTFTSSGSGRGAGWETQAAMSLMNDCYAVGVFDPERVRGVGAWMDDGQVVVHAGTHIVAGDKEIPLTKFKTGFIYEANRDFGFNVAKPMTAQDASKYFDLVERINWERPASAVLFLGWCAIAPVCGALYWRPHLWLTGGSGTGKSTALKILQAMVGPIALKVQANTTEPGLRQLLSSDARAVMFDEIDSDSRHDNDRIQTIISLVRASSSQDGGVIAKGGSDAAAATYSIRSCFCFSSVAPKVATAADRSRVTVLSLVENKTPGHSERWAAMSDLMNEILTPERTQRLIARTLSLLPVLLENAKVFARAAAAVLGQQRAGDQLGTLLAGAYSLRRSDRITYEAAKAWISERDWTEIRNDDRDEDSLLSHILEQVVTVEASSGLKHERTVGELVLIAADGSKGAEIVPRGNAAERLGRIGLKVDGSKLWISNSSIWITRALSQTNWAKNHNKILSRLPKAEASAGVMYFGPGIKTRGVAVPIELLRA